MYKHHNLMMHFTVASYDCICNTNAIKLVTIFSRICGVDIPNLLCLFVYIGL